MIHAIHTICVSGEILSSTSSSRVIASSDAEVVNSLISCNSTTVELFALDDESPLVEEVREFLEGDNGGEVVILTVTVVSLCAIVCDSSVVVILYLQSGQVCLSFSQGSTQFLWNSCLNIEQ